MGCTHLYAVPPTFGTYFHPAAIRSAHIFRSHPSRQRTAPPLKIQVDPPDHILRRNHLHAARQKTRHRFAWILSRCRATRSEITDKPLVPPGGARKPGGL